MHEALNVQASSKQSDRAALALAPDGRNHVLAACVEITRDVRRKTSGCLDGGVTNFIGLAQRENQKHALGKKGHNCS
jgi:hypothetical protein